MAGLYINGEMSTHATAEISFALPNGKLYRALGITAVNYAGELTRNLQYGTSSIPLGSARGNYKPTCDVEMYKQEWRRLRKALGKDYGSKFLNLVVTDRPKGGELETDTVPQCLITKVEDASSGEDARKVKITMLPHDVIKEGNEQMITTPANQQTLAIR